MIKVFKHAVKLSHGRSDTSLRHFSRSAALLASIPLRQKSKKSIFKEYGLDHITPFGWSLLLVPATAFGLGIWQWQCKGRKDEQIEQLRMNVKRPPVDLPEDLSQLEEMEYHPVRVRGRFLHDKELVLGPRVYIEQVAEAKKLQLLEHADSLISGYQIVTPFQLEGRDETILINRGWVPRRHLRPSTRQKGQISGTVEVIGVVRKGEKRSQFMPKKTSDNYTFRDLPQMCEATGAAPVFLDATIESTIAGGPIGGQTTISLQNEHLTFVITWLGLSGSSVLFWFKQVVRQM